MNISVNKAIRHISQDISYEEAVASAEGAHYAINFLNKVKLRAGEKAMVNGGTGAIGSSLIQLLKFHGLQVVATGPTEHLEKLLSLGAERAIDYKLQDFTQDDEKYDYVFDSVGKSTFGKCERLLTDNGIYISSELGPYSQNPFLAVTTTFSEGKKVRFPLPLDIPKSLKIVSELLETGKYKPLIDRSYSMHEVKEAFEYVMSRGENWQCHSQYCSKMISLFRKTRRWLINQNKFGRYILYAIGEVVLIVIGILIALGINNWNQRKATEDREQFYLAALKEEFLQSRVKLQNLIGVNRLNYEGAKKIAGFISDTSRRPSEKELSELLYSSFSYEIDYNPNNSLLTELINSGQLKGYFECWFTQKSYFMGIFYSKYTSAGIQLERSEGENAGYFQE
ncbi:DUF6090 family protein (plasmid) [Tenacibaculum sp. ZS6-P6]|uniref:DUF6090 family protein n=1 Tax=Tenacibaculum sp. ZS6-P6 TaxID=3447503 RepID=UPI003F9AF60A